MSMPYKELVWLIEEIATRESGGQIDYTLPIWKRGKTIEDLEREVIMLCLTLNNQNRSHAAIELGIGVRTIRNKLTQYRRLGFKVLDSDQGNKPTKHLQPEKVAENVR